MAQAAIAAIKVASAWLAKKGIAQAIVKLGIQIAASTVLAKLTTRAPGRNQGALIQTALTAEGARRVQVGKRLTGGIFVDWLTKGSINEDTWRVFYLGEGPMGNVTSIFADGRRVFSGTLTHGSEVTLTALDSRVRVRYYDGRPGQTADANLVASSVGWTSNHVGTGMAYCVVYARFHDTKLVVPPDMSFEVEGAKLYDRRQDTTAGGSGSQRLKDPSTWAASTNPAVALDHFLLGRFLSDSDDEPWFGVGLDPSLVPYADFVAMANLCDEQVALKVTGTQDRYSMNGFIFADEVFRDVIRRICDHMNARPADFGGLISVIDGESKVPVLSLDKSDAIDESAEVYKPKAPYAQLVGGIEGRYQDPANNYQPTDYPRYTEAAWKAEDGGETRYVTRDFDYEINQERAERLASLFAKRSRRQATLSGIYPLKSLILEEGDWFTRTGGKFGVGKVFEVVGSPVLDVESMTVAIQSVEVDPTDSAWDETAATDQAASPDSDPSAAALSTPSVTVTAVNVSSGGTQIPGLRFEHADYDSDPPIVIEIEVAENDGSDGPEGDRQTMFMVREQQFGIMTGLLPSTGYVARWKGQIGELESAWSSWSAITTTGSYAVGSAASATIADTIVDQGWGATASESDASNDVVRVEYQAGDDANSASITTLEALQALANTTIKQTQIPQTFEEGLENLTAAQTGAPDAVATLAASANFAATTGDGQPVVQVSGFNTIRLKNTLPVRENRVWEVEVEFRTTIDDIGNSRIWLFAEGLNVNWASSPGSINNGTFATVAVADGWVKRTWRFTNDASLQNDPEIDAYDAMSGWEHIRLRLIANSISGTGTQQIRALRLRDVTPDDSTRAMVSLLGGAFTDGAGNALAQFEVTTAVGSDPARLSLLDGAGGSNISLDADEIFFGSDTVFEDTNDTFYTESGGERYRYGGPFGASSDLLLWFGPTSVALNSETTANGTYSLDTGGKVNDDLITSDTDSDSAFAMTTTSAVWETVLTVDVDVNGVCILTVSGNLNWDEVVSAGSTQGHLEWQIKRGSTVIRGPVTSDLLVATTAAETWDRNFGIDSSFTDIPSPGSYTYTVEVRHRETVTGTRTLKQLEAQDLDMGAVSFTR